jgi:hypothetical protein
MNCSFVGARGLMRVLSAKQAIGLAQALVKTKAQLVLPRDLAPTGTLKDVAVCNACAV